jgi:three-Cys-motif partner protein
MVKRSTEYISAGPWTLKKLICLKKYLYAYTKIIPRHFKHYYYIDTNAGPGVNKIKVRGDEYVVDGSPLIAIKTRPHFTDYVFVEKKAEYALALKQNVERVLNVEVKEIIEHVWEVRGENMRIRIVQGDCNFYAKQILSWIPLYAHCFVFIDPSGLEVSWETVKTFGERKRSELLVNFQLSGIWRCIWQRKSIGKVDKCLGTNEWRKIKQMNEKGRLSSREAQDKILELYVNQLRQCGFIHFPTMPVENLRGRLLYTMVFSTRNDTAGKIMYDIMNGLKKWRGKFSKDMVAIALGKQTTLETFCEKGLQLTLQHFIQS